MLVATAEHPHVDTKMVDLTPYSGGIGGAGNLGLGQGFNWVREVTIDDAKENQVAKGTIVLQREQSDSTGLSLSPWWPSRANGQITVQEEAALWVTRRIQIWTQLLPQGSQATPSDGTPVGDWDLQFDGYVDSVELSTDTAATITLSCRDRGGPLQDYWVTDNEPQVALSDGTVPPADWFDDLLTSAAPIYELTFADFDGATRPALLNALVTNTYNRDMSPDEGGGFPEVMLYNDQKVDFRLTVTPRDKSQDTTDQPVVRAGPLLGTLQDAAIQIGWYVRYRWRPADLDDMGADPWEGSYELAIYTPGKFGPGGEENGRSYDGASLPHGQESSGISFELAPDVYRLKSTKVDVTTVRNRVSVPYKVKTTDMEGNEKDYDVPEGFSSAPTSLALYGVRSMRLTADATGLINKTESANAAAKSILRDLSVPWTLSEVECPFIPFVELGDCVKLAGPNRHSRNNVWLAVDGFTHRIGEKGASTTLKGRQIYVTNGDQTDPTAPLTTAPLGTPPAIDLSQVANNFGNFLDWKRLQHRAAVPGVAPGRSDSFSTKLNVASMRGGNGDVVSGDVTYLTFPSWSDPFGAVADVTVGGNTWTQWCAKATGTYEIGGSAASYIHGIGPFAITANIGFKRPFDLVWTDGSLDIGGQEIGASADITGGGAQLGPFHAVLPAGTLIRMTLVSEAFGHDGDSATWTAQMNVRRIQ